MLSYMCLYRHNVEINAGRNHLNYPQWREVHYKQSFLVATTAINLLFSNASLLMNHLPSSAYCNRIIYLIISNFKYINHLFKIKKC